MADPNGSNRGDLYGRLALAIRDPRFVFMNHGYADPSDDFDWPDARHEPFRYSANLVRRTLRGVDLAAKTILDLGCGRGGGAAHVARHTRARRVIGMDLSRAGLDACQRAHRHETLWFVRGDAHAIPLPAHSVDVVLNVESAHCYTDLQRVLAEVRRVLVPGGVMCHADTFGRALGSAPMASRHAALVAAGLRVTAHEDITAGVVRAIVRSSADLVRLFFDMIAHGQADPELALPLLDGVTTKSLAGYLGGGMVYGVWQAVSVWTSASAGRRAVIHSSGRAIRVAPCW